MTRAEKFSQFSDTGAVRQNLKRKSVRGVFFMVGTGSVDFIIRLASTFLLARLPGMRNDVKSGDHWRLAKVE